MVRKWSGDSPEGPEVIGRFVGSRETIPEVWKWSGDPPSGLKVVERPSRRSRSGRGTLPKVRKLSVTLPEVLKWSEDAPGCSDVVGGPS